MQEVLADLKKFGSGSGYSSDPAYGSDTVRVEFEKGYCQSSHLDGEVSEGVLAMERYFDLLNLAMFYSFLGATKPQLSHILSYQPLV